MNNLVASIDNLLLTCHPDFAKKNSRGFHQVPLHHFRNPIALSLLGEEECSEEFLPFRDLEDWTLKETLDVTVITRDIDDGRGFQLTRLRSLSTKEKRKIQGPYSPTVFEYSVGFLTGGKYDSYRLHIHVVPSFGLAEWDSAKRRFIPFNEVQSVLMAVSVNFSLRYIWTVKMSLPGSLGIQFPTDPDRISKLYKNRAKDADRDRRAALLHWVREHQRGERRSFVREHGRGEQMFLWNGIQCEVVPALYDVERWGLSKLFRNERAIDVANGSPLRLPPQRRKPKKIKSYPSSRFLTKTN